MAILRRKINYIRKIRRGKTLFMDSAEIEEEITLFFFIEKLYSSEDIVKLTLEGIDFPSIQEDLRVW